MNKPKSILVLDGETRAALAVVRSLGRHGLKVIVASEFSCTLAGSSRYCTCKHQYPSPMENIQKFIHNIFEYSNKKNIDVIIPITDATTYALLQNRTLFNGHVEIPLVPFETYWAASNKISLMKTAASLNIPCPSTIYIDPSSHESLQQHLPTLNFPVIVKPQSSIQPYKTGMRKTGVCFAENQYDLLQLISKNESFLVPYMLQEVIDGDGIGIFAFCLEGEVHSVFSHRRIREKPPWGGVSVVCESTVPDPIALNSSRKLLKALNWSGVAMVEFKRDNTRNNIPVLMEINARFWGSLQLAIDAGIDFPMLMYHLSQKIVVPVVPSFTPARSRWLLGDLDHLIIRLKSSTHNTRYPQRLRHKIGAVFTFLLEFLKGSTIEELRYHDRGPFWHALKLWLKPHQN